MSDKTKWSPNEKQRSVLIGLRDEAAKEESAAEFCRQFLNFKGDRFSKIMNALDPDPARTSYFDEIKRPEELMLELAELLAGIPQRRLEMEQRRATPIYALTTFRAAAIAIDECKHKANPERIVKYIMPTGGGKTTLRQFLMEKYERTMLPAFVESREAWRPATRDLRQRAKVVVLNDIAEALDLRFKENFSRHDVAAMEDRLLKHCIEMRRLLFIDEAEFFGSYALNLIKLLLNKTRLVIVIACTPRAHAKWNSYYSDEADQISRRTHAVISAVEIAPADAALFFPANQFENAEASLKHIAAEASLFGHYSTISRIAELLARHTKADRALVEAAVSKALKQMSKERTKGK